MISIRKLFSFSFRNNRVIRISFSIIILLLLFLNLSLSQKANLPDNSGKKEFRASVVKIDITPDKSVNLLGFGPRKSTGVLDHIFHRIVALDDGTTQFFLVSTDICLVSPAEYDRIAARIKSELGISLEKTPALTTLYRHSLTISFN
jgi:neutral ceramidase